MYRDLITESSTPRFLCFKNFDCLIFLKNFWSQNWKLQEKWTIEKISKEEKKSSIFWNIRLSTDLFSEIIFNEATVLEVLPNVE